MANDIESKKKGKNFLGILNDLKRRPEDVAKELDVSVDLIHSIVSGEKELSSEIIDKCVSIWPVSKRDFHVIKDDCPEGVKIMRSEDSKKSSRIMNRAGKPYYEYRDTAMSSVSQFRPEWIKELCVVDDNDPNNPNVQWNNGHFMHQFTYFIGPVNFYYKGEDDEKKVAMMNTGDTMYITPFVPHTFTTRCNESDEKGLILALTYGNKIAGETQQELSALGASIASKYVLDFSTKEKAFASLLKSQMNASIISRQELSRRSGIEIEEIKEFERGNKIPNYTTLLHLALSLRVNVHDILPFDKLEEKVIVEKHSEGNCWFYPEDTKKYEIIELSTTSALPFSKLLEITIHSDYDFELDLQCGLHQYGYNVGESVIQINWKYERKDFSATIGPGDSFYMKPHLKHNFRRKGKLLISRIGGRVMGDAQRELSLIGKENVERAVAETMQWFDEKGKKTI